MKNNPRLSKTKAQILEELEALRCRVVDLEAKEEERLRVLEALRESEEKYRILLEESSDPIFTFYPDGEYRYVNKAFADGVGRKLEDIIGNKIWDVFSKDEADKRFAVVQWVFEHGETRSSVRPHGWGSILHNHPKPIFNERCEVISKSDSEITERKHMNRSSASQHDILTDCTTAP
jgi:PAS domain S-box-containing protein